MVDPEGNGQSTVRPFFWMTVCGAFIVLLAGAILGFTSSAVKQGGLAGADYAILAAMVSTIATLAYLIFRLSRGLMLGGEALTRRERLNRNIMTACVLAGALTGFVLAIGTPSLEGNATESFAAFAETPLPLAIALALAIFWGLIMPAIAWFWHKRVIDEQEASAYRDGGYYAAYAYLMGAPVWWFLWRGGLLPEPSGVAIFLTFCVIWTGVWYWKKYR